MAQAFKCKSCGKLVSKSGAHSCAKNFETINLEPKEFCAKFGHTNKRKPVPGTYKTYSQFQRIWEDEEGMVDLEGKVSKLNAKSVGTLI